MNKILETIKNLPKLFKKYWKVAPEGRYMSYKEIASYATGSIGVRIIIYCVSQMLVAVGNTLVGNTIGINPRAIYIIYIISLISAFPLTALRANMIDNTRSMKGKYRPYLITMGLPTAILGTLFVWMPYAKIDSYYVSTLGQMEGSQRALIVKCAIVLAFNIGFQFFYNFYTETNDSLINVLSPNSIERSDVLSIKNIVENISPSILSIFFPLFAKLITGEDTLFDIRIYKYLFPPMLIGGFLISLVAYVNTEEKIVQAKSHFIQIKFVDAFRQVARNKYFWIISLGSWLGFLEGAFGNIIQWLYNYQHACTPGQYSLIIAISGNASFWPNIIAPYFIRKFGKRKVLIFTNVLNIGLIAIMYPAVRIATQNAALSIWIMLVCVFVNTLITGLGHLLGSSINADIRDYQQYISGERIDGMFAAVGLVGNVIGIVTGAILPEIYNRVGLNEAKAIELGYDGTNVYDVLNVPDMFVSICSVLIMASVVGAVMNVIPYFFYNFSETKQRAIVKVLKIRAMFEDYGNGVLKDDLKAEGIEIITDAKATAVKTPVDVASVGKDKSAVKAAKQLNEDIEISQFILDEMEKFNTPAGKAQYEYAKLIFDAGINGIKSISLPAPQSDDKQIMRIYNRYVREIKRAIKSANKYYAGGEIVPYDISAFDELFSREDKLTEEINKIIAATKKARESKNDAEIAKYKQQLNDLHAQQKALGLEIKIATNENTKYNRSAKPYIDAIRVITQKENYENLDAIMATETVG